MADIPGADADGTVLVSPVYELLLVVDVVEVELELPCWYVVLEVLVYPPVIAVLDPLEFT
tara:strand:+ start:1037 stop:1216 length:180 start_codon:yes stop_codon:yes gene_type:complete